MENRIKRNSAKACTRYWHILNNQYFIQMKMCNKEILCDVFHESLAITM